VRCIAVDAVDRRVCAGVALLADSKGARMLFGLVEICTNSATGVTSAKSSRVTIDLAIPALRASSVCNIVIQLAPTVANNEVLSANIGLLHIACKCNHNCRVCFVLSSVSWGEPLWGLPLDQLWVVRREAV
jgi:hypothetical protein